MKKIKARLISGVLSLAITVGGAAWVSVPVYAAAMTAGGWYETIYADISGVKDADVTEVSYSGPTSGSLKDKDLEYLVRDNADKTGVRIDIPGLEAGDYTLSVKAGGTEYTGSVKVYEYDRAGYAHRDAHQFGSLNGVGAYKDDGTLKDNAIVLYVTNENKNTVTVPGYESVVGIGNILNEKSTDTGSSTSVKVMKELRNKGIPLVVRFVGPVYAGTTDTRGSEPEGGNIYGLTECAGTGNGGSASDDGMVARIYKASNVTLEGIGTDAAIDGWGFQFIAQTDENCESFEVRNLTFKQYPEDALGFEGTASDSVSPQSREYITSPIKYCWVHNNIFEKGYCKSPTDSDKSEGDGSVDFKRGYGYTLDYNKFIDCHKTNLIGSGNKSIQYDCTFHHNMYENVEARQPLARHANVHIYNSYFVTNKVIEQNFVIGARAHSYVLSEANFFEKSKNVFETTKEGGGFAKSFNDILSGTIGVDGSLKATTRADAVSGNDNPYKADFDTAGSFPYEYTVTDATQAKADCVAKAGVMKPDDEIDMDPEPITIVPREPSGNLTLPYTLDISSVTTAGEYDKDNAIVVSKGAGGSGIKVNGNAVIFAVGQQAVVTFTEGGKGTLDLVDSYGKTLAHAATSAQTTVTVPVGIYILRTAPTDKDAFLTEFNVKAYDPNEVVQAIKGDVNNDNVVSKTDAKILLRVLAGLTPGDTYDADAADYDSSLTPDIIDVIKILDKIKENGGSGNESGGGQEAVNASYTLTFDNYKSGETTVIDDIFTVNGNLKGNVAAKTYGGVEYTTALKMETKTVITFTTGKTYTLTLITDGASKSIKVGNTTLKTDANGVVTTTIEAGSYSIAKGDSVNLYAALLSE